MRFLSRDDHGENPQVEESRPCIPPKADRHNHSLLLYCWSNLIQLVSFQGGLLGRNVYLHWI